MPISFPKLPYSFDALEPAYTAKTLELHYTKHHRGYFDKTLEIIKGGNLAAASIEEIIRAAAEDHSGALFNNAAQLWNHTLFWNSMA